MINCEVELILTWSKNCVLAAMTVNADIDTAIVAPSGATFKKKKQNCMFQLLFCPTKMIQNF